MKFLIKKLTFSVASFSFLTLVMFASSSPLQADKPFQVFDFANTFIDLDPCTGLDQEITLYFTGYLHVHKKNFVLMVDRSGESDAGYYMFSGNELQTFNTVNQIFRYNFVDMWRNVDGRLWQVRGLFMIDETTGDVKLDKFSFKCLNDGNN